MDEMSRSGIAEHDGSDPKRSCPRPIRLVCCAPLRQRSQNGFQTCHQPPCQSHGWETARGSALFCPYWEPITADLQRQYLGSPALELLQHAKGPI